MTILETERLILRELDSTTDAEFIFALLNTPKFLQYIGDRDVHTVEQAGSFIEERYRRSYRDHGFGLYAVELRATGEPVGLCGFVKRDQLPNPDIGFAFLPEYERFGYGYESAGAVLDFGRGNLSLERVLAIVSPGNIASERLLEKLGFARLGLVKMADDPVNLFSLELFSQNIVQSPVV